jgi:hypothetical protein
MKLVPSRPVRRLLAGLTPIVILACALPLLAPTCGGFQPGVKTFAKGAIIIPMDVCYQCTVGGDGTPTSCGVAGYSTTAATATNGMKGGQVCPQATKQGDVIKAYGLVYQLIRNGISVYWVIQQNKAHLDDYDLTVQYNGGAPVQFYNWAGGGTLTTPLPTAASAINYMGGIFVVDGSDLAAANAILQDGTKIDKTVFNAVNLHVSNVSFQAYVARTMAGGWDAGGAKIPKLAMLDIAAATAGSTAAKNSYIVIAGYLQKAGLTTNVTTPWPLGGTSAAGNHGQIFDRLTLEDFLPRDGSGNYAPGGLWTTSTLYKNSVFGRQLAGFSDGYAAIWVPHWTAPGSCATCTRSGSPISCSDCAGSCTCATKYPLATTADALRVINEFQKKGADVFAECAGLGSFEGVPGDNSYSPAGFDQSNTHFQTITTPGFSINAPAAAPAFLGSYPNPLMQLGDFQLVPHSGAIANYSPKNTTSPYYVPAVVRLISQVPAANVDDIFTLLPNVSGGTGAAVYMGGHSYSGTDGYPFNVGGSRLVLNTLFNLGATCVATGATCSTGLLGICATGTMQCDTNHQPYCKADHDPGTVAEVCNGLDDDCNGLIDDNIPSVACYTGPVGTNGKGICRGGTQSCQKLADGTFGFGACLGQQLPSPEVCDNLDNDCNGVIDDPYVAGPPATGIAPRACYTGPSTSVDPVSGLPMGICKPGTQTCSAGVWGSCSGQITPRSFEICGPLDNPIGAGNGLDDNCNGLVDEGCGCTASDARACYTGPASSYTVVGTDIVPKGDCRTGTQTCTSSAWGACTGQVLPAAEENCSALDGDADCNGVIARNEPGCQSCSQQSCYEGPASSIAVSGLPRPICQTGLRTVCTDGTTGACIGQILPSPEVCDGKDNDCNGLIDDGAACGAGLSCINGNCVLTLCGGEQRCPTGYACVTAAGPTQWSCQPVLCPTTVCPTGQRCDRGACDDPCAGKSCGAGTVCAGGVCSGGACYLTGCPSDQECRNGSCVPNPCATLTCPSGTFCRDDNGIGDCVQSCTEVACAAGQRCDVDGFCVADPCNGITCNPGDVCIDGSCVANACNTVNCGTTKICDRGTCKDDPCSATVCPTGGVCLARDSIECAGAPCLRAQCFQITNLSGGGTETPPPPPKSGCGCGAGQGSVATLLLGLLLLPLARRRRRPGTALPLLVALAATGLLTGCPSSTKSEPQATCGADACNSTSLVAPFVSSLSPSTGLKGSPKPVDVTLSGARFIKDASVRIFPTGAAAVLSTNFVDADHLVVTLDLSGADFEPYLLRVVNPDHVISNLATFTAVAMPPTVASVLPTSVTAPTVATLTVSGSNFTPLSACWMKVGSYAVELPSALVDPTKDDKLACTLDTSRVSAGATEVWVVNEQGLASTARLPFLVNGSLKVTAVSPPSALVSTTVVLTVYGAGFDNTCTVTVNGIPQTTTFVDPTRLTATYVTPSSPGTVSVTVTKSGATTPTPVSLTVVASGTGTTIDTLTPQSAYQGQSPVRLTFTGTAIPTSPFPTVELIPSGGAPIAVGVAAGTAASVYVDANFTNTTTWAAGDYQARLNFGGGSTSATFPFALLSNVPALWSFTSTTQQQAAASASVSATGTTLFTGATLSLLGSGGFTRTATGSSLAGNVLTGTFSLANMDTGAYQLVAKNTTSAYSNPLTFTVIPGLPVLSSITPACVVQGSTLVTLTLAGNNFAKPDSLGGGGSIILVRNPGLGIPDPTDPNKTFQIPATSVTVVKYDTITIAFDTTTAVPSDATSTCTPAAPCPYKVKVYNPGTGTLVSGEVNFYVKTSSCP